MKLARSIGTLERRASLEMAAFTFPALLLMTGIFAVPLLFVVKRSVTGHNGALSLGSFRTILTYPMYARIALTTLEICLLATACALLFAYPLAYYLARQPPRRRGLLTTVVLVPFWSSAMVKSFAFVVVLGHAGIVNTALERLGLGPWALLFNRSGVIIGMCHYLICFALFPILTNLLMQPPELRRAAAIMGAGPWRIFWRVTFPLSLPGVVSAGLLAFIIALGFYVIPELLGGLKDTMLSSLIEYYANVSINWSMAAALSVLLTCIAAGAAAGLLFVPGGGGLFPERDLQ